MRSKTLVLAVLVMLLVGSFVLAACATDTLQKAYFRRADGYLIGNHFVRQGSDCDRDGCSASWRQASEAAKDIGTDVGARALATVHSNAGHRSGDVIAD